MDTDAVVSQQIEEGHALLLRLSEAGFPIAVAGWAQRAKDGRCVFLIASPLADERGSGDDLSELMRVFRSRQHVWLQSDDIRLIGATHPRAVELLRIRERISGRFAGRFTPASLAGLAVRKVYVYPAQLRTELSDLQKQLLVDLYRKVHLPVDALPYTEEMEQLHRDFVQHSGTVISIGTLFRTLLDLQKQGRLAAPAGTPVPGATTGTSVPSPVESVESV